MLVYTTADTDNVKQILYTKGGKVDLNNMRSIEWDYTLDFDDDESSLRDQDYTTLLWNRGVFFSFVMDSLSKSFFNLKWVS